MEGFLDFYSPRPEELLYREAELCALDFETTGLYPGSDEIIEIGALRFTGSREVSRFESLIRPLQSIPAASTAVHGIDDAMVASAPLLKDTLPALLEFIGDSIIVAHNVKFDMAFLTAACGESGLKMVKNLAIDTCSFARAVLKGEPGYSLQRLNGKYRLVSGDAHRALDDARTAALLLDMIVGRIPEGRDKSLSELITLSRTRR